MIPRLTRAALALLVAASSWAPALAQSTTTLTNASPPAPDPASLDSMLAPIALYPDPVLSQVLVASTYPLEIVQAEQWLKQNPSLKGQALTDGAKKQNWDPSVQALVAFPDVLKRLADDVLWTTNIGNNFLASQSAVLDSIQRLRKKAQDNGKLASSPQATVVSSATEGGINYIAIESPNPDFESVPTYDPDWIWGPPVGPYPYPYYVYPPPPPAGVWVVWGEPVAIGVVFASCCGFGWGWGFSWGRRHLWVNRDFFVHSGYPGWVGAGRAPWRHDPDHRGGVAYPSPGLNRQFHPIYRPPMNAGLIQQQLHNGGSVGGAVGGSGSLSAGESARQTNAGHPAGAFERIGSRRISTAGYNRGRTAFGGVSAGRSARTFSSRGRSSLGRVSMRGGGRHR